ncbi:MAG: hypothetical protein IT453_06345 [Planctomycetes bacterium]|nr:hypothetical protein [Planctomycetota bacterium]
MPFPRGLEWIDGQLYVLARGRSREAGGANTTVADEAGTIFRVDPTVAEPANAPTVSEAVRTNGEPFAIPTAPPFRLFDVRVAKPTDDRVTDRPYCTLRFHPATSSFYVCAFSGIDKSDTDKSTFSKNLSDAILRYDLRTSKWYEVERHDIEKGGLYPHHDPAVRPAPHGWLNGPDNCLAIGDQLYAVAKDNCVLVRYDLSKLAADPEAGAPASEVVFGSELDVAGLGTQRFYGHSALAHHDGWLYVAFRTSSEIVRIRLGDDHLPKRPLRAELVARFDPYDPTTKKSANLTDIAVDREGRLYVLSAKPSRVFRFAPDPEHPFDGRSAAQPKPWVDLGALVGRKDMKSENILIDDAGRLYVPAADPYDFQQGANGTVYRITEIRG